MHVDLGHVRLRKPEPADLDALLVQKNDPEVAAGLVGFSTGWSRADLVRWLQAHEARTDEALYVITDRDDACLGHVALYRIDRHARSAEFGVMVGAKEAWGTGIGRACTRWALRFGFADLGLHRISLVVFADNARAVRLYESCGFVLEGRLRDAQWRDGGFTDLLSMSVLDHEWRAREG